MPKLQRSPMRMRANKRYFATTRAQIAAFRPSATRRAVLSRSLAISGRTLGAELKQPPLGDHQIRQAEQRHQLRLAHGVDRLAVSQGKAFLRQNRIGLGNQRNRRCARWYRRHAEMATPPRPAG